MSRKYKALIFDMDGVLVDNNEFHYRAFKAFCDKYKVEMNEEIYNTKITGRTNEMIMEYLFGIQATPEKGEEWAQEKEALYREIYKDHIVPAPGLVAFLQKAQELGISASVGSNGPMENLDFVLDVIGMRPAFKAVVNARMVKQGKPAPDIYLKCAELMGFKPEDCVIFEDSPTGIKAGNAAGIDVVGLTTTHREDELQNVIFICKDFTDERVMQLIV
jgi:beta-phosphoglucomutase